MKLNIVLILSLAVLLSNCAIGPTSVEVTHSGLLDLSPKRTESIAIRKFSDTRTDCEPTQIGNKRNGFGMVLGSYHTPGGETVAAVVTRHFSEALQKAGYSVMMLDESSGKPTGSVVVEGDIHEFWLDLYTAVWHNVGVKLRLMDASGTRKLWEKDFNGGETNVLWLGIPSEIEKVIRQAMDEVLRSAAREFNSESFARAVANGTGKETR